jgi:aspartate/methionine/tyrosine aminotransferase
LRAAIASFYDKHYGVALDSENEILPLLGSKEGIMYFSMAFLNPGDTVLVPNPGYPAYKTAAEMMGANVVLYDLKEENNWYPVLEDIGEEILAAAKIMWVTYPNMPTGQKATIELYERLVSFSQEHNVLVVNDNPYSFILNDEPMSLLSVPGALQNCMELNSMSKAFNMAGWRVGMVSGRKEYIDSILRVKSNVDSGMFKPVQDAAAVALNAEDTWFDGNNVEYAERRKLAEDIMTAIDCTFDPDQRGMFVWARIPSGLTSEELVEDILQSQNIVITPGTVFGSNGEGYVRISLCSSQEVFKQALSRLVAVNA